MSEVDLMGMKALKAVVETGSINAAARHLKWSKSSLSRRLCTLESSLGEVLVERQARGAKLTQEGEIYFRYVRQMLALAEEGKRALIAQAEEPEGKLVIRVSRDFSRGWIGKMIVNFMDKYPKIDIEGIPDDFTVDILNQTGDLWVWAGPEPKSNLRYELLAELDQGIYVSERISHNHDINNPNDLVKIPWYLSPMDEETVQLRCEEEYIELDLSMARLRMDSVLSLSERVASGECMAILPVCCASCCRHSEPEKMVNVLPDWKVKSLPVGVLSHFGPKNKAVNLFIHDFKNAMPDDWRCT